MLLMITIVYYELVPILFVSCLIYEYTLMPQPVALSHIALQWMVIMPEEADACTPWQG